ncbi:hypothetical protein D3C72_1983500 [compost metagenome]
MMAGPRHAGLAASCRGPSGDGAAFAQGLDLGLRQAQLRQQFLRVRARCGHRAGLSRRTRKARRGGWVQDAAGFNEAAARLMVWVQWRFFKVQHRRETGVRAF